MNKIKPLDRQSLIDVALQTSGSVEGALGMSIKNDIPVSGGFMGIEIDFIVS